MHFTMLLTLALSFLPLSSYALHLLEGERPYSPSPLSKLYHTPSRVTETTVNRLLDILQEHGLTQVYGIYALHTHLQVSGTEVLYLTQAPEGNFTSISVLPYATVKDESIPMTHQLQLHASEQTIELIPIEHGSASDDALLVRQHLSSAISNGLLSSLFTVLSSTPPGQTVGLSQILPIHRTALAQGYVVLNQLPDNKRQVATIAPELGGASLGLFTRGLGRRVGKRGQAEREGCEVAAGCVWRMGVDGEGDAC